MMTKTVYQTDRSGVYVGAVEADESPREAGTFLLPAGAVEAAPPDLNVGEAAVWDGSAWAVASDHRGEIWFKVDGESVRIDGVGDPAAAGYLAEPPDIPASSDPTVNGERDRRIASGFTASISGGTKVFSVDTRNRDDWANIHGLFSYAQYLIAQALSPGVEFHDADNVGQILTPTEMIELGLQAFAHKQVHYKASWDLKETVGGVPADFTDDKYWPAS